MLEQAFNSYASIYDNHFTNTGIGKMQRGRVYYFLHQILFKPSEILELNCGTGEDARYLSLLGHSVTGTDLSESMIEIANEKTDGEKIKLYTCSIQNILSLNGEEPFDIIFSNFGGLNCLDKNDIYKSASDLYQLTKEEARLFLVVMGRKCIWERWYFRWKRDKGKAFRRLSKEGVLTIISGEEFMTYYYSPKEIAEIFSKYFAVEYVKPVGLFIPPSYLDKFFSNKKWLLLILQFAENIMGRLSFLSDYADHYAIVLKKKI
jgi:SAM-dependent methyltransferase